MKSQKGFTLIEILIVIAIIGILSSLIVVTINQARFKARDAVRIENARQIGLAMELYIDANETYPVFDADSCSASVSDCPGIYPVAVGNYLQPIPADPVNAADYYYRFKANSSDPRHFCLIVNRLDTSDQGYYVSDIGRGYIAAGAADCPIN